jgi:hypothetical protein
MTCLSDDVSGTANGTAGGCDGGTCVMSTEPTEFLPEGFCEAR